MARTLEKIIQDELGLLIYQLMVLQSENEKMQEALKTEQARKSARTKSKKPD
jgi:hypothetical protein